MAAALTIRNLTSSPITLIRTERFQDPNTLQSKSNGYVFGSSNITSTTPTSPELGEHAQSFNKQDLNVRLEPFEAYTLGPHQTRQNLDESELSRMTLRLTIEADRGERFRIDTHPSYTQRSSQSFTALSAGTVTSPTALFHPSRPVPHLTIHTNHLQTYTTWMKELPDNLPISAISIPGAHNSHTHYRALPSVRCQVVDIQKQLDNGVRFLDIRLQPVHATDASKKDLYLVHGAFPISLTGPKYFEPILQTCYDFLSTHPSETLIISLKREGVGSATDEHLAHILETHYIAPHASKWYTGTTIPYLGSVRGKLILLRRYTTSPATSYKGLDATSWPHNATHALFPASSTPTFCLQDFCEVLHQNLIRTKIQHCNDHLVRAAQCHHHIPGVNTDPRNPVSPAPLYLNFLSASNFWKRSCWPQVIAREVNRRMEEWLCEGHGLEGCGVAATTRFPEVNVGGQDGAGEGVVRRRLRDGDAGTGVVVMDGLGENGDWELVRLVVGMNMGVLMKMKGAGDTSGQ